MEPEGPRADRVRRLLSRLEGFCLEINKDVVRDLIEKNLDGGIFL